MKESRKIEKGKNRKFLRRFVVALVFAGLLGVSPTYGMGKAPSSGGANDTVNQLADVALTIAIMYGKTDPRYAPILMALGINTPDDVKAILKGDGNGANLNNVVSFLIMGYAQKDPKVAAWLDKLGVKNFDDLKRLIQDPNSKGYLQDTLFSLAFQYASSNPKYAPWLAALNIQSGADIAKLLNGGLKGGNLQSTLIAIGMAYLISKNKGSSAALQYFPTLNTGAYQGLPLAEIQKITSAAKGAK